MRRPAQSANGKLREREVSGKRESKRERRVEHVEGIREQNWMAFGSHTTRILYIIATFEGKIQLKSCKEKENKLQNKVGPK